MGSYSIRADETALAALATRAEAGEEIVLSRNGHAVAKIIPFPEVPFGEVLPHPLHTGLRPYAQNYSGIGRLPDSFDDPLPEEVQRAFGMCD